MLLDTADDQYLGFHEVGPVIPFLKKYSAHTDESIKELWDAKTGGLADAQVDCFEFEDFIVAAVGRDAIAKVLGGLYDTKFGCVGTLLCGLCKSCCCKKLRNKAARKELTEYHIR